MSDTIKAFWRKTAIDYCEETGDQQYELANLAAWAIRKGLWEPQEKDVLKLAARSAASALKALHVVDSKGRPIREFICAKVQGKFEWAKESEATDEFKIQFVREQSQRIDADIKALRNYVDHLNEDRAMRGLPDIQLDLAFDQEVAAI